MGRYHAGSVPFACWGYATRLSREQPATRARRAIVAKYWMHYFEDVTVRMEGFFEQLQDVCESARRLIEAIRNTPRKRRDDEEMPF